MVSDSYSQQLVQVLFVNGWTRKARALAWDVERMDLPVTSFNPHAPVDEKSLGTPHVILVGYGRDPATARIFLSAFSKTELSNRVPVVVAVERESDEAVDELLDYGVEQVVLPPIGPRVLRKKLEHAVRHKRQRDSELTSFVQVVRDKKRAEAFGKLIVPLGVAMMAETEFDRLLELILSESKQLCNADGGTLYLVQGDGLKFQMLLNDTLGMTHGSGVDVSAFRPIPLRDEKGRPNRHHIAAFVANSGESANVRDAYLQSGFDFSGTREFDGRTGYRTRSVLTMPLKAKDGHLIGVLQLINARDPDSGEVTIFDSLLQAMAESLSLLAAQALQSYLKHRELQERLNAMAIEVDERSKHEQVRQITDSSYFRNLKQKAQKLRGQVERPAGQEV